MNKKLKMLIIIFSIIVFVLIICKIPLYYLIKNNTNTFNINPEIFDTRKNLIIEKKSLNIEEQYYKFENLKFDKNILNNFECTSKDNYNAYFEIKDDSLNVTSRINLKKEHNITYLAKNHNKEFQKEIIGFPIFPYNIKKDLKRNNITNDYLLYKYIVYNINKGIKPTSSYYNMEKYVILWALGVTSIKSDLVNNDNEITPIYDNSNNYLGYIIKYKPTKDKENSKMTKINLESKDENYEIILYTNNEDIFNFDDDSIKEFISTVQIEK